MEDIQIHPSYVSNQAYYYLAVIKVAPVDFGEAIAPICLPKNPDLSGRRFVGRTVMVAGWGSYNLSNIASDNLKTAALTIQSSRYVFKKPVQHLQ